MTKKLIVIGCVLLLIAQLALQVYLAKNDAQTTDEGVHLSAGYTYITRGDFRFNPEHPPLVKILAALPLLIVKPNINTGAESFWNQSSNFFYDSWRENRAFGEQLLYDSGNNAGNVLFAARLPIVLITFLLGLTIFLISKKLWGNFAALVATVLYTTNPIVNGHGHLVTTDIPLALTFLLTIYYSWQFFTKPSWKSGMLSGLFLGLALLTKHTAIIAFPALFVLLVWGYIKQRKEGEQIPRYWRTVIPKMLVGLIVTWVVIWAGFGFHDRLAPATSSVTGEVAAAKSNSQALVVGQTYNALTSTNPTYDKVYKLVRPIAMLFPGDYIKGVFMVLTHVDSGQSSYLLGHSSTTGWWYYFPVLFLLKTPIPELVFFGMAIYYAIKVRPVNWTIIALLLGAGTFIGIAMLSHANLGVRHILPIFPLLMIAGAWAAIQNQKWRPVIYVLLVWALIIAVVSFPTYLGYFNEFAGGSSKGYKVATDSNLDWGQDLKRIDSYIQENHLTNVYLEYNWDGLTSVDYYLGKGNYKQLSTWLPGEKGTAIVGASAFDGPDYTNLHDSCTNMRFVTNAVIACDLN